MAPNASDGQPIQQTQPKKGKPAEIPVPTRNEVQDFMRGVAGERKPIPDSSESRDTQRDS